MDKKIFESFEAFNDYLNSEQFKKYCENIQDSNFAALRLQYKILFRRKDLINEDKNKISECLIDKVSIPQTDKDGNVTGWEESEFTFYDIIRWNKDWLKDVLGDSINKSSNSDVNVNYYTDPIDEKGNTVIGLFFAGVYPMLDVIHYDLQQRPSEKLKKKKFFMIFDEVGTGKTVSALYCIRDVVAEKGRNAKILITCPFNKKNEWKSDIARQLGLYSHIAVYKKGGNPIYRGQFKELFFKETEPCIFIEGQGKNGIEENLNKWSENEWDLVVIDEGHLCFESYSQIKAEKAVLMTATPIVTNTSGTRDFDQYINLLKGITDVNNDNDDKGEYKKLDNLFKTNDLFSQLFREDLEIEAAERQIEFISCDRMEDRDQYLSYIRDYAVSAIEYLHREQDDDYLVEWFEENKRDIAPKREKNKKATKLITYLNDNDNNPHSFIIFFNHISVLNNILGKIKDSIKTNVVFAQLYGNKAEICCYDKNGGTDINSYKDREEFMLKIKDCRKNNKRVLLFTTGGTGGTGLNLGEFDGVINYELPFTSIELEQRFGRVDRMDKTDGSAGKAKKMVFFLNKDSNPMLYYPVSKIDIAVKYMPIRNTLLFTPEYIDILVKEAKKALYAYVSCWNDNTDENGKSDITKLEKWNKQLEDWAGSSSNTDNNSDNSKAEDLVKTCYDYVLFNVEDGSIDNESARSYLQNKIDKGLIQNAYYKFYYMNWVLDKLLMIRTLLKEGTKVENISAFETIDVSEDENSEGENEDKISYRDPSEDTPQNQDKGSTESKNFISKYLLPKFNSDKQYKMTNFFDSFKSQTSNPEQPLQSNANGNQSQNITLNTDGIFYFNNFQLQHSSVENYRDQVCPIKEVTNNE